MFGTAEGTAGVDEAYPFGRLEHIAARLNEERDVRAEMFGSCSGAGDWQRSLALLLKSRAVGTPRKDGFVGHLPRSLREPAGGANL
jgi:hypothetical protein